MELVKRPDRMGLTPSMEALAALTDIDVRRHRAERGGKGWRGYVIAGHSDGQCPCWQGDGATRDEALERAAANALYYWTQSRARRAR